MKENAQEAGKKQRFHGHSSRIMQLETHHASPRFSCGGTGKEQLHPVSANGSTGIRKIPDAHHVTARTPIGQ
jgi:hypothetical protein